MQSLARRAILSFTEKKVSKEAGKGYKGNLAGKAFFLRRKNQRIFNFLNIEYLIYKINYNFRDNRYS